MAHILKGTVIARAVRTASPRVLCASVAFPRKVQIPFPLKARNAPMEFQQRQMSSGVGSDREDVPWSTPWSTSASTQTTTPPENFRYRVGTSVVCYLGTLNWAKGEIVKHNFEQPKGKFHPYQVIKCLSNQMIIKCFDNQAQEPNNQINQDPKQSFISCLFAWYAHLTRSQPSQWL